MRSLRLIAAAGALGIAASATATAAWGPPQRASSGPGDAHSPDVAANGAGVAAAAWVQEAGTRGRVVASILRGGTWSRPSPVSPPGLSAVDPRVAVGAAGRVVVVWRQVARTRVLLGRRQAVYVARARERGAGGGWGPVATLSDERQKVGVPELAVDGRGAAVAAWHWGTGTRAGTPGHIGQIQIAEKPLGRGWSRARRASRAGGCVLDTRLPHAAAGVGGHAIVWWQCDQARGRRATDAVGRGPSPGAWSAERRLPFGTAGDQVADLAVDPTGAVLAVSAGDRSEIVAWRGVAPLGGARGLGLAQIALPGPQGVARDGGRPAIAAAPTGTAVAGWVLGCQAGPCGGLGVADIGPAATASRVTTLDRPVRARFEARVAAAGDGSAVALARAAGGVIAASRSAGGDWTIPQRISATAPIDAASGIAVAAHGPGAAIAVWAWRAGGRSAVERAELEPGL